MDCDWTQEGVVSFDDELPSSDIDDLAIMTQLQEALIESEAKSKTATPDKRTSLRNKGTTKADHPSLQCLEQLTINDSHTTRTFQFYEGTQSTAYAADVPKLVFVCEGLRYVKKGEKGFRAIVRGMEVTVQKQRVSTTYIDFKIIFSCLRF